MPGRRPAVEEAPLGVRWRRAQLIASGIALSGYAFEIALPSRWGLSGAVDAVSWLIFVAAFVAGLRLAGDRRAWLRSNKLLTVIVLTGPIGIALLGLGGTSIAAGVINFLRAIRSLPLALLLLRTGRLVYLGIIGLIIVVAAAANFSQVEDVSFASALYWATSTVTIGPQEFTATHAATRISTIGLSLLGIGFLGAVIGSISAALVERQQKTGDAELESELEHLEEDLDGAAASAEAQHREVLARLDALATQVAELERRLPPPA